MRREPENLLFGGRDLTEALGCKFPERVEAGGFEREGHFGVGPIVTHIRQAGKQKAKLQPEAGL